MAPSPGEPRAVGALGEPRADATPAARRRLDPRAARIWQAAAVRNFRLLWASEAVSVLGDQFHAVALSWLVITLTGSGLALGAVLIAVSVPRALLMLPMGVVADRQSPRTLMLIAHAARAAIVAATAALVITGTASIPALAALGALFGAADAVYIPAQQAFLPRSVGPDRLPSANALLQGTLQFVSIVGPTVAGLVVAAGGTAIAFGLDAASFVVAAWFIALVTGAGASAVVRASAGGSTDTAAGHGSNESFLASLRGGLRYVLADRGIGVMIGVSIVLNFALNGPAEIGMAWLVQLRYHAGAAGLGLIVAGWAAGGLLGTVIAGNARLERQGRVILAAIAVSGASMGLLGVAGSLLAAVGLFAVAGVCIGYVNIVAVSWLQARVHEAMLGRVMSLAMLASFGITPLSMAVAGVLIDVNATALFIGAGALVVVAVLGALAVGAADLFDAPRPAEAGQGPAA